MTYQIFSKELTGKFHGKKGSGWAPKLIFNPNLSELSLIKFIDQFRFTYISRASKMSSSSHFSKNE
jgi:hypothetical protein